MKRILNIVVLLVAWVFSTQAQDSVQVLPSSRIWLEGSSSVNEFTCNLTNAKEIDLDVLEIANFTDSNHPFAVKVGFPVRLLDCGQKAMNNDMFDALKSKSYPTITFQLTSISRLEIIEETSGFEQFNVVGTLTVAGVSKKVTIIAKAKAPTVDSPHKIVGSYNMDMLDFDVEPPTALWGLIKANKNIVIHFDAEVNVF